MVCLGFTRCYSKRTYFRSGFGTIKTESERYVFCQPCGNHLTLSYTEALAASTVKIAGKDVLSTWKILISLGVAPILYAIYAFLATFIAVKANAPLKWIILTPFLTLIALPFMSYGALKFGEAGMDVLKCVVTHLRTSRACVDPFIRSLRPLVIALFPGQQRFLDRLKKMRAELSNELTELINELGPKLWDDFDHVNLMFHASLRRYCIADINASGEFLCLLQACRLRQGSLAYGAGKAELAQLMLRATFWCILW